MKRLNNLFPLVYSDANIQLADKKARNCKLHRYGVRRYDKNKEVYDDLLYIMLEGGFYKTSKYDTFKIYEPKERLIFRLPYYPDRITHHAIMNITEPIWTKIFTDDTYACIKGRGIHKINKKLSDLLRKNKEETKYCLKFDITKFYPSINHDILKEIIRRKIKDKDLLRLLDEIIDSAEGVPIGNYLSQYFANLYLAYFDHWVKEEIKRELKKRNVSLFYFRYADDGVILSNDKQALHSVLIAIKFYLKYNLMLKIKDNYQIFPVESRGIDFVGYKFYHTHTVLRKSIKKKLFKLISKYEKGKISKNELQLRLCSYFGWLKYCDSKNLLRKIYLKTGIWFSNWRGNLEGVSKFYKAKSIRIYNIEIKNKYYIVLFTYDNKSYLFKSRNKLLLEALEKLAKSGEIKSRLYFHGVYK